MTMGTAVKIPRPLVLQMHFLGQSGTPRIIKSRNFFSEPRHRDPCRLPTFWVKVACDSARTTQSSNRVEKEGKDQTQLTGNILFK